MSDYFGGDDELIERLRHTLHTEAAALRPSPQEQLDGRYQAPGRLLPFRPRWTHGLIAVAAAAAIAIAVIEWPGSGHQVRTVLPATSPTTVVRTHTSPTTVPPQPGKNTTTTAPPATLPIAAVPASFQPGSVTFVSSDVGWALGSVPCGLGSCLSMASTRDGGHTWVSTRAPSASLSSGATLSVRFADGVDGWVYLNDPSAGFAQLWSTHDAGDSWRPQKLAALSGGQIEAFEVSRGTARLVILGGDVYIDLYSSPVGTDDWTRATVQVPLGAGPVPSSQLVLQRDSGWVLENDRTVVGGAELDSSGQWQSWTPPCSKANGDATLAASDPTNLAAICDEGFYGTPDQPGAVAGSQWLFLSSDGGASFRAAGALPKTYQVEDSITTSGPSTVVAGAGPAPSAGGAGQAALVATFDGGRSWQAVYSSGAISSWVDVGFTNVQQGVAVGVGQSGTTLLMTRDGGHTWAPVDFQAQP